MTNLNLQNLTNTQLRNLSNFSSESLTTTNLKTLSNEELNQTLLGLVRKERQTLGKILLHIQEVHRRKLYLKMSYGSLFDYLTNHLKYSAGSAQRRIDACRLSQDVPGLIENLESGDLTLAQVSLVQKSFREKERELGQHSAGRLNRAEEGFRKVQVLNSLKQKSIAESQVIVAKSLDLEVKSEIKLKHQADESVRLEITLTKKQWQKLNQMRHLLSHSLPHGSWDQVLEYVADRVIASKTKVRKAKSESGKQTQAIVKSERENPPIDAEQSLYKLRKIALQGDQCCQYRDQQTQKLCASTWQLQVDHIKPRWAGGTDEPLNLRILCAKHNRQIYRWQSGMTN